MKNALLTAATLVVLLSTSALAQQRYGYPSQPGYDQRSYGPRGDGQRYEQPRYDYDYDDRQFDRHLDWWDRELNLTRRQERDIRRIRDRFQQQSRNLDFRNQRDRGFLRELRQREFFDMMAVLRPDQRDRVLDRMRPYERYANRGNGRGPGQYRGGY